MAASSERVLLGTSGWSYKEWVGPFYSKEDKSMLRAITRVFKTVEIDSTFYRYPTKGTVMGWARYSPEDFIFTAKLPGLITHEKKLKSDQGIQEDLERFIELMEPLSLSGKLGCILIQLPPKFTYKPRELEDFFRILPTHVKFAVEFRDLSWMRQETWALLEKYRVAYTVVDEPLLPPEVHLTSDLAYFRWHGRGTRPWYDYRYRIEELEPWIPKVKEATGKVAKVYGYFNNHYHGHAVENCLQVLEMLGALTPEQTRAKKHVEAYFEGRGQPREVELEAFIQRGKMGLEDLLGYFVPGERLKRARDISDDELIVTEASERRIEARIREYHIVIDFEKKTILHDCADWGNILPSKKLCKHIAKLLLSMNSDKASKMLKELHENKETWQFKPYTD